VIIATGGGAGYTLFIKEQRLVYEYNFFSKDRYRITSDRPLPTGKVQVAFEYRQQQGQDLTSGGTGKLFIDGQPQAKEKSRKSRQPAFRRPRPWTSAWT
jgi:hypothetical protein